MTADTSATRRAPAGRARPHRRLRLALRAAAGLAGAAGGVAILLWLLTPSVADARQRVDVGLARHGAPALTAVPSPDRVGLAVVATEDQRFFSHPGVDLLAVGRVVLGAVRGKGDEGGATLDQQLAKLLYTPSSSGPWAEVEQVVLAVKLDQRYSKAEILRMYLDAAYFGNGDYGLSAAAQGYFATTPGRLSWGQASLLAGLLPAPSVYDPFVNLDLARQREQRVLDRLVAVGTVSRDEAQAAYAAPLNLTANVG